MRAKRCAWFLLSVVVPQVAASAAPLPALPDPPHFDANAYPACPDQRSWESVRSRVDRFEEIQHCIDVLERYNLYDLPKFPKLVLDYTVRINKIDATYRKSSAPLASKQALAEDIKQRIAAVASKDKEGNYGELYGPYYEAVDRYRADARRLAALRDSAAS